MLKNRKQIMKKCSALLCTLVFAMPRVVAPQITHAAVNEVNRTYDATKNSLIEVSPWNANHRYIKNGGIRITTERIDSANAEPIYPNKSALSAVPDPISKDNSDMVIRIAKDSSWTNAANFTINQYQATNTDTQFPIRNIKSVSSFNFMLGGDPLKNAKFLIQSNGKSTDIAKIEWDTISGKQKMSVRTSTGGWNYLELEQNKWYTFAIAADFTGDDAAAKYFSMYVNGQEISTIEGGENGANFAALSFDPTLVSSLLIYPGVTTANESIFYYDDFRVYEPTAEAAAITLTSPVAEEIYMGGARIKLESKTHIGTGLEMIEKVEYYDGDTKVAESSVAPYTCYYIPANRGNHSITAKMYLTDVRNPVVSAAVKVISDFTYAQENIVELKDYNGTAPSNWRISATTKSVVIDEAHGTSMQIGNATGSWVNYLLPEVLTSGYVKISGEYYIDEDIITDDGAGNLVKTANNVNNTLIAELIGTGATNVQTTQISGTTLRTYVNKTQSPTNLTEMEKGRWYSIDIITKLKNAETGYLNIYLDGKRVYNNALPVLYKSGNVGEANITDLKAIDKISNITFAQLWNTGILTLDNMSINKLDVDYEAKFYSNGSEISSLNQIIDGEVTAVVNCDGENDCQLILSLYDVAGNLENVTIGNFNSADRTVTATFNLGADFDFTGKVIKAMVWDNFNNLSPINYVDPLQ